jgi:hypothetical protein
MVTARIELNEYANQVLNVVKAQQGLHDKSEAINVFIDMFGEEFVEKQAKDKYLKKIMEIEESHFRKHKHRKMSLKELDAFCEE